MIAQALVKEHNFESIDHLHAYGQLGVDALERMTQLSLQHARDTLGTHAARAQAMLEGERSSPLQVQSAVSLMQSAMAVFTDSYEKWVELLDAQIDTMHRTAHATYADLQRWSPAGTEIMVEAAELLSNAAERTTELAAESSAAMLKAVGEIKPASTSTAVAAAEPAPATTTRKAPARRTATRKTA